MNSKTMIGWSGLFRVIPVTRVCWVIPVLILGAMSLPVTAQVFHISGNVTTTLSIPWKRKPPKKAFVIGSGEDEWRPLSTTSADGKVRFTVSPGSFSGDEVIVLLDPPADLDIDDHTPPVVRSVLLDGIALPLGEKPDDLVIKTTPKSIIWHVVDKANALDAASTRVRIDGITLARQHIHTEPTPDGGLKIAVEPAALDYGRHRIALAIADTAPLRNICSRQVVFRLFDASNLLRPTDGKVDLKVDSHYPEYPSAAPLIDGVRKLPGSSAGNDVTWASAETAADHWIQVRLPHPVTVREATIHWARPAVASRSVHIQIPAGDGWRTVADTPVGGYGTRETMTWRFAPVTTDCLRFFQPAGSGPASRPNLMWVTEVEAR